MQETMIQQRMASRHDIRIPDKWQEPPYRRSIVKCGYQILHLYHGIYYNRLGHFCKYLIYSLCKIQKEHVHVAK